MRQLASDLREPRLLILVTCLAVLFIGPISLGQSTGPVNLEAQRALKLIDQLDDADAQARRTASMQLNSLGGDALEVVEAAGRTVESSPEARRRLNVALKYLRPRARRERKLRQQTAWEDRLFQEAYRASGNASAKWDALAERGIALSLRLGPDPLHGPAGPRRLALDALQAASDAGCKDPLIDVLSFIVDGRDAGAALKVHGFDWQRLQKLLKSDYPAVVKLRISGRFLAAGGWLAMLPMDTPEKLLDQAANAPGMPDGELDSLAQEFYSIAETGNYGPYLPQFAQEYKKIAPKASGALLLEARSNYDLARRLVRQIDGNMGPETWKQVTPQLKQVDEILEAAWKADPADARAATMMITIKLDEAQKNGNRESIESWFKRAMEADPDDYNACHRKLVALQPGWGGSQGAMLEFSRDCLRTENWRAGLPMILVLAHEWLSTGAPDSSEYFARPEVWQDLDAVFEGAVVNFPNNAMWRSSYAKYAAKCGQWQVAHEQFERLGPNPLISVFGSRESYEFLRDEAARRAVASTQPLGPGIAPKPSNARVPTFRIDD